MLFVIVLFIVFIVITSLIIKSIDFDRIEIKQAGNKGERIAKSIIKDILFENDYYLYNVKIQYKNRKTELDNLIINEYGIFIIEVKNLNGKLVGGENDYEWTKYKQSYDDTFVKKVKNPIKQVKREASILGNLLKEKGIYTWVNGYVYFVNNNSTIRDKHILNNVDEINKRIHTTKKKKLSNQTINEIKAIICDALK